MSNRKLSPEEIEAITKKALDKMKIPFVVCDSATGKQIDSNEIHRAFIRAATKVLNYINLKFGVRQVFYTPQIGVFSISMN